MSIAKLTGMDLRAAVSYIVAFVFLFGFYWAAAQAVKGIQPRRAWAVVIGGAVLFSAILLWLYPVDALDIFDYIIRGRMQVIHGGNPFYQAPISFKSDPFYHYAGWGNARTAYGPGWELLAALVVRLAGDNLLLNILGFKFVAVLAYAGTAFLIARTLLIHAPERALFGTVLFAWNPLVLYVVAGNGHNDSLMVLCVGLGFYWMAQGRFTLATLAQVAGALVKFIPALLVPLMLIAGWKRIKSWPGRIGFLLLTGGASLLVSAFSVLPYWRGGDFFGLDWRGHLFTTSLPTWAVILLQRGGVSSNLASVLSSRAALILLGAWILRQCVRLWRAEEWNWAAYVRAGLSILLFYLLVACLWFQPWYTIWGVALAALLPDDAMTRGAVFLSLMSNWKMIFFDFGIVRNGPQPPFQVREWPLAAATLGPAWAYFIYTWRGVQSLPRRLVGRGRRASPAAALAVGEIERE